MNDTQQTTELKVMNQFQRSVLDYIVSQTLDAKFRFHSHENVADQLALVGRYAFALYHDLIAAGQTLRFAVTLQENVGLSTNVPEFFQNLHVLEDFVGLVSQTNAPGIGGDLHRS